MGRTGDGVMSHSILCPCGGAIHEATEMHYRTCEQVLTRTDLGALGIHALRNMQERGVPIVPVVILDAPTHSPHWHGPKGFEPLLRATGRWYSGGVDIPDVEMDLLVDCLKRDRADDLAGALGMLPAMHNDTFPKDTPVGLRDEVAFWHAKSAGVLRAFGENDLANALLTAWNLREQERNTTRGLRRR